jgi:hypothetical protein
MISKKGLETKVESHEIAHLGIELSIRRSSNQRLKDIGAEAYTGYTPGNHVLVRRCHGQVPIWVSQDSSYCKFRTTLTALVVA